MIAVAIRSVYAGLPAVPIVEKILRKHIDPVAGIYQFNEELPIFSRSVAIGFIAADCVEGGWTIDRIGISVDVLNTGHDVRTTCRSIGVAKAAPRNVRTLLEA